MCADTILIEADSFATKDGHIFGLQVEVGEDVLIDTVHLVGPMRAIGIGLALMNEQAANDPTLGLCLLGQRDETPVGIAIVGSNLVLHPIHLTTINEALVEILVEETHRATIDSHLDNGYRVDGRKVLKDGASEIIGGRQEIGTMITRTAVARLGHTPLSHLAVFVFGGSKIEETRRDDGVFFRRDVTNTYHVGLTNGEESNFLRLGLLLAGYETEHDEAAHEAAKGTNATHRY